MDKHLDSPLAEANLPEGFAQRLTGSDQMPAALDADPAALLIRKQHDEIQQLLAQLAKRTMHDESVRRMRRNLLRLGWWHWTRRRRIIAQLAEIALSYAEYPTTHDPGLVAKPPPGW